MNMLNLLLLAFLDLISVSHANCGRGHDKKCKENSTTFIELGQPVVNVCDNGHYTRLWMCPVNFWCSKSPEAHCAVMNTPSKQCSECDMTMHKCLKNCNKYNDKTCIANCKDFVCKQSAKQCRLGGECDGTCSMSFLD